MAFESIRALDRKGPVIETSDSALATALAALGKPAPGGEAYLRAAGEYRRVAVFDQALDYLDRALEIDPRDAAAFEERARVWRDMGWPDFALGDAHRAVYFAPASASAHNTLGTVRYALGDRAGARAAFERVLALDAAAAYAHNNLCYLSHLDGDDDNAKSHCARALALAPDLRVAHNNLGLVHAAAGRIGDARSAFVAGNGAASGLYNLGIAHLARREYTDAADAFDAALREAPEMIDAERRAAEARALAIADVRRPDGRLAHGQDGRPAQRPDGRPAAGRASGAKKEMTMQLGPPEAMQSTVTLSAPQTLAESGLRLDLVMQLLIKSLHFAGELTGLEMADKLGLSFTVIEPAVEQLKSQHLCEIVGGTTLGPPSYRYRISMLGRERAKVFLDSNMYVGYAPVPLEQYKRYMKVFHDNVEKTVSREQVKKAMSHLVLSEKIFDQLGPAINAGHSLFVYGPPGNGKSVISQAVRNLLPGDFYIPHALEADGQIIQVYDPVNHEALPAPPKSLALDAPDPVDRRWVHARRPLVTVGGELELESLDLSYISGFYRAPLQLISNGGALVIDDFGRQKCSPHALLNRWITPLEARVDYLTLQSGQKVEIPFMVLPIFATNIKPVELVDEAFLRRIHYKVFAESPNTGQFIEIFENCCRERGLKFELPLVRHLIEVVYPARKLQLRGCHPRDLIDHAISLAKYRGEPQRLTINLLEGACDAYFVDEDQGVTRA